MGRAYYNEIDPAMAATLRELIRAGLIAPGDVDERSIEDVLPSELAGYTQCHFFAGLGVWSYALRCAGWSDDRLVWTGSCPCQPFSQAGKREGIADERHLWPSFFWLIQQCQPSVVFGEQVASKDGLAWLDIVQSDLEAAAYAVAPFDLCAAGFGAPHIRRRLFFVAESAAQRYDRRRTGKEGQGKIESERFCDACDLGKPFQARLEGFAGNGDNRSEPGRIKAYSAGSVAASGASGDAAKADSASWRGATNGFWRDVEWVYCRDGKYRAIKPGTFPLAHGVAARVAKLRGIGNAIVAPVAEAFIRAYLEIKTNG